MKKKILTLVGGLAFIALMAVNFQSVTDSSTLSDINLKALVQNANAFAESGECTTKQNPGGTLVPCGNGNYVGEIWNVYTCGGDVGGQCLEGLFYAVYKCDGTIISSGDQHVGSCEGF